MKNIIKIILIKLITTYSIIKIKYNQVYLIHENTIKLFKFSFLCYGNENTLDVSGSNISRVKLEINGENNLIKIHSELRSSTIKVSGKNNSIYIDKDTTLSKVSIIIHGDECCIHIKSKTTIGGARLVCMGISNSIIVGCDCQFSDGIEVWASDSHPIFDCNEKIVNESKPIVINDSVWIGAHCKILKGIVIGEGAIIGMGSIVTKDIPPFSLNVGIPTKVIKSNVKWGREFISI